MAQFDVYRLADGSLVLDCQSDLVGSYDTRFVVPLIEYEPRMVTMTRLHPRFTVADGDVVMVTQFATAVRARELRHIVGSLAHEHLRIVSALDMLISGY